MHSTLHQYAKDILTSRILHYIETPQSIVEHYKNEKENIYSYNGRQLLEMLQNADDAAQRPDCQKTALVRLKDGYLTIANHGHPFSQGGLESILFSNLSPKAMEQNMIGQKGLGFRSILSWAEEVIISSDDLNLVFSEAEAKKVLEQVISAKPEIRDYLLSKTPDPNPIAILRVPAISEFSSDLEGSFDTIITIKLKEGIQEQVQSQIKTLVDGETLLFLNNLNEVRLESPERNVQIRKTIDKAQLKITIHSQDDVNPTEKLWNVESRKGAYKGKNYELKIAWTDNLELHSGKVHSYFRTNDTVNFPGLIHGTFELTPDRNHLVNDPNGYNIFLISELAVFMSEVAELIASSHKPADYAPLIFLNIDPGSVAGFFKECGFIELLAAQIKTRHLFPNVNGDYVDFEDNRVFYEQEIAQYLKGEDVSSLLLHYSDNNLISFIRKFGNYQYKAHHFAQIISTRTSLPVEQYCALILCLLDSRKQELNELNGDFSSLKPFFTDDRGRIIPWENEVFLPDEHGDEHLDLPAEIKVSFLNKALCSAMLKTFGIQDYIYLDGRLLPFKFRRLTITGFADILKEQYLKEPTLQSVITFHQNLNRLSSLQLSRNEQVYTQNNLKYFPGISRSGKIRSLADMYFGIEYEGELTEELLKHNGDLLLASPESFGFLPTSNHKAYFKWLGVETEPQLRPLQIDEKHPKYKSFKEHMLSSYDYQPTFGNTRYTTRAQAEAGINVLYVDAFEHLNSILENAPYTAIFKWIKENYQLKRILESKYEAKNQPMLGSKHINNAVVYKKLPNYTRWQFGTIAWIPAGNANVSPQTCCISKTIGNLLSPLLIRPAMDELSLKRLLDTDNRGLEEYFRLVGIHLDLGSLSTEQLYTMLYGLPYSDPNGKLAKSLYQEVMSNFEQETVDTKNEKYQKFVQDGKIWAAKDGKFEYVDISRAFYLETKRYGENITSEFHLVPLQRKQGNPKVKKLFGVEPLIGLNFTLSGNPAIHPLNGNFKQEMEQFKALAYALVLQYDSQERVKSSLRSLNINLVSKLTGSFEHAGIKRAFELEDYDFVIVDSGVTSKYYIKVPLNVNTMLPLRAKLAFAESVAEIFSTIFRAETQRSFIRELYSRQPAEREELLMHEIQVDGYQKLLRSRELLGLDIDQRANFWRAVFLSRGTTVSAAALSDQKQLEQQIKNNFNLKETTLQFLMEQENFKNLFASHFISASYELFSVNGVQVIKFNEHFEEIDFERFLYKRYEMARSGMQQLFEYSLYQKLSADGDWQERSYYFDKCLNFSTSSFNPHDGFQADIPAYLSARINSDYGISMDKTLLPEEWSISSLFLEKHAESGMFQDRNFHIEGISESQVQSLLLFGETEILAEKIKIMAEIENAVQVTSDSEGTDHDFKLDDYKTVAEKMDARYEYEDYEINVAASQKTNGTPPPVQPHSTTRTFRPATKPQQLDSEMIGFIAEKFVYESLKLKYPNGSVLWISENGKRAGVYVLGAAGHGYDIEYTDNGRKIYVEVKCIVSPELGFNISNNELSFALANAGEYLLITVEHISKPKPLITSYPGFFLLDEHTLFDNPNFKIKQDNYNISFRKKL